MTDPAQDLNERYPGLSVDFQAFLAQAAAEGRDLWLGGLPAAEGQEAAGGIVLDERVDDTVFLRQADPCDGDDLPRVHIRPGDRVVMTTPIFAASINSSPEVGRVDDLITWTRVVLDRREPGVVYGRSLRSGEADDGRRVHVRPGEEFVFEAGALALSLDEIDSREEPAENGYSDLASVLWTWFHVGGASEDKVRYVLAAARRLDAANALLIRVQRSREALVTAVDSGTGTGPEIRRHFTDMLTSVELMVVALGRAVDLVVKAQARIGVAEPLPPTVVAKRDAVKAVRDAYEHIEDRALGLVFGKPHPNALTIFDHQSLLREDKIVYDGHSLDLVNEVPALIAEVREFLKTAVAGPPAP